MCGVVACLRGVASSASEEVLFSFGKKRSQEDCGQANRPQGEEHGQNHGESEEHGHNRQTGSGVFSTLLTGHQAGQWRSASLRIP
jgi:hypothetical protein